MDRPFIEGTNVAHLVIDGLILEHGRQHGIVLRSVADVRVQRCEIRRFGGTGLVIEDAKDATAYGNRLCQFGHGGIVMRGNRTTAEPCGNRVENNEVGFFELRARTYNPALQLDGVGACAAHNWFHDGASSALNIRGSDLLIEYNRIERVVQESDDQGGLDICANPYYTGNVIRYNYWKDLGGGECPHLQGGVRLDGGICHTLIYGNVFERVSMGGFGAVQINGGQGNIVDNNVFTECRIGVSFNPWDDGLFKKWYLQRDQLDAHLKKGLIHVPSAALLNALHDPRERNRNFVWRNRFCAVGAEYARLARRTDRLHNASFGKPFREGPVDHDLLLRPLPPLEEMGRY